MSPELRHLRAFLAVAEERSFTRAADRLFVTQQQLSRQIAQMEDELGLRLFERTTRRVELTDAGERMLDQARRAVRTADRAFAIARDEDRGALRVDVSSSSLETGAVILERLRRSAPDLRIEQVERGVRWGLDALRRGELDVLLGDASSAPEEIAGRLVRHEPILVGMARGHELALGETVAVGRLHDVPLLLPSDEAAAEWNAAIAGLCRQAGSRRGATPRPPTGRSVPPRCSAIAAWSRRRFRGATHPGRLAVFTAGQAGERDQRAQQRERRAHQRAIAQRPHVVVGIGLRRQTRGDHGADQRQADAAPDLERRVLDAGGDPLLAVGHARNRCDRERRIGHAHPQPETHDR